MDTSDLSQRQRAILDFILETVKRRGYPPSVREIGEATGLHSPSTVHAHLGHDQVPAVAQDFFVGERNAHMDRSVENHVGRAPSPAPDPLVRPGATRGSRAVRGDRPTTIPPAMEGTMEITSAPPTASLGL